MKELGSKSYSTSFCVDKQETREISKPVDNGVNFSTVGCNYDSDDMGSEEPLAFKILEVNSNSKPKFKVMGKSHGSKAEPRSKSSLLFCFFN